jgi:hypothetical protein
MAKAKSLAPLFWAVVIAGVIVAVYLTREIKRQDVDELRTDERVMICAETGKTYNYTPHGAETMPYYSPYSHKKTGYLAERCYWTKDGKAKLEPTFVLLNEYAGKEGKTYCPDCGREVVRHNPVPPMDMLLEAAAASEMSQEKKQALLKAAEAARQAAEQWERERKQLADERQRSEREAEKAAATMPATEDIAKDLKAQAEETRGEAEEATKEKPEEHPAEKPEPTEEESE